MAERTLDDLTPSWRLRLRQAFHALRAQSEPDESATIRRWLTPPQQIAFLRLAAQDRAHLVRVAREIERRAPQDRDLIVAGLLHDIGKADEHGRVRAMDRVIKVVFNRAFPRMLGWLARPQNARFRRGIVLAVHHAELGASLARELGCSERTISLIKQHEIAKSDDPALALLVAVDRATP